jgi:Cys-rich four helix bundle protein (predicted Tat secretion target)
MLLAAVNDCLVKGQQCIAHCPVVFQEGGTSLAECAVKVHEMQAICDAYDYLPAANSEYIKDYARICVTACEDCEIECRRHDHHVECRECAEACEQVVALAKKLLARVRIAPPPVPQCPSQTAVMARGGCVR